MDMIQNEKKWKKHWAEFGENKFDPTNMDKKHYVLEMFSYPSAAKLHIGHWYNYGPSDSYARFMRMMGKNVFQPMGFDSFGLPAENFAIKTGIHPMDSTYNNIDTMHEQLGAIGAMFDWENEVITSDPEYYKWTQWMFLQLYKKGLAYRKEAPVNWCESCQTVLANEQVKEGLCERCKTVIVRKNLTQWFFKITDYAEELLSCLDTLDWPEKTKIMQKNWIGKSVGGDVEFKTDSGEKFTVFTTHPETIFGTTFVVMAPEIDLVQKITKPENKAEVDAYIENARTASDIERLSSTREKTGVFTGAYAINPLTQKQMPILVADYVLSTYGTGCVMGVPAHDERDFEFATKYNLDIPKVITNGEEDEVLPLVPSQSSGKMINSGIYDGLTVKEGAKKVLEDLNKQGLGEFKINYRLRDWLVSRQRYWGAPIPIIHCDCCGEVPVPESELPVKLPYDVEFKPDGKSPLAKCEKFVNTTCPICGKPAKRDCDTLDTFVCSSWYYLRYPDNKNSEMAFDPEIINKVLPVDKYIGGAEHACMHLLYARFFTKALRDMGYLNFDEPFTSLVHQGLIMGEDGEKMSKSRGNVVSPDTYVEQYGSDTFRMYMMFGFSYVDGGPWNDGGIKAVAKYLERVERVVQKAKEIQTSNPSKEADTDLDFVLHNTIKSVKRDMQAFSFNTAIARLMELTNAIIKYEKDGKINREKYVESVKNLILLLAPCAPHFVEELWRELGGVNTIFAEKYPDFDVKKLVKAETEIAIQINSKIKARISVPSDLSEDNLKNYLLEQDVVKTLVEGKTVVKFIVVQGRLANFIVK